MPPSGEFTSSCQIPSIIQRSHPIRTSLATHALALYYEHRGLGILLCDDCFRDIPEPERDSHDRVLEHYVIIGNGIVSKECSSCYVILAYYLEISRSLCLPCLSALDDYLLLARIEGRGIPVGREPPVAYCHLSSRRRAQ